MHTSGDHSSRPRHYRFGRLRELAVPSLALAAVLAGVVMAIFGATKPRAFGWFAYAPLSETTFYPENFVFVDPWAIAGLVLLVAGLLVLAFMAGYRMGRRRPARRS